ncbi:hypothetical protein V1512DRAFT_203456 [Lipomyces arxii]|uniref:uncharacterized protein n=1 Tax=Lipomyces arxii TaxID=56418 RepID=UPI0034CE87F3
MKNNKKKRQNIQQKGKRQSIQKGQKSDFKRSQNQSSKAIKFYDNEDSILLVGEGDLSFTKALIQPPHSCPPERITATVYDSKELLLSKYPDTASDNLIYLNEYTVTSTNKAEDTTDDEIDDNENQQQNEKVPVKVLFNVDGTNLTKTKYIRKHKVDKCIFNFPHTGSGITDQDRNVLKNQGMSSRASLNTLTKKELILAFFKSVAQVLKPSGLVMVTVFEGLPYSLWQLKDLAKSAGFSVERSGKFDWTQFPQYRHRKTSGTGDTNRKAQERDARTFVFTRTTKASNQTTQENLKRKHDSSDSDSESD